MSPERVLLTGGGGQLASELQPLLSGRAPVSAPPRARLDVTDAEALEHAFAPAAPDLVVNCAAFHNVEVCEREEEAAFAVNAVAVKRLAQRCARHGSKLVHLSTNYVFDGERPEPYAEDDHPSPGSVYAISKLAGEHAALAYAPGALVVRTAGLYGLHGSASKGGNFVTRMLDRAREGAHLRVVSDQQLSPTFTADLAAAIVEAVEVDAEGLVHLTNSGSCSWHGFTEAIMRLAGYDLAVEPQVTQPEPDRAQRPLNGVLSRPRADRLGLSPLRSWDEALADYVTRAELAAPTAQLP